MGYNSEFIDISQFGLKETKQNDNSILYEMKGKEGYGKMLVFRLYSGIDIYFNDYNTTHDFSGKFHINNYFQISYSHEGTYEFELKDKRCIYIGEGELIAFHNIFETVQTRFPREVFKGIGITFDIDTVNTTLKSCLEEFNIDLNTIINILCLDGTVFVQRGNNRIRNILEEIYFANPIDNLAYIKIKVLELLILLSSNNNIEQKYKFKYYEKSVGIKIKDIKEHLIEDLSKHITIEQLANEYCITKTMLKTCFKDIYGLAPYEFLKQRRMEYAASLIKKEMYKINEVGVMVGYQNASKFTYAFKDVMGVTPSEYSKRR